MGVREQYLSCSRTSVALIHMANISNTEKLGRAAVTITVGGAALWGMFNQRPFDFIDQTRLDIIGIFRAIYGFMIILRLLLVRPAAPMVLGWRKTSNVLACIYLWLIPAVMMMIGFLTPIAILAHILFGSIIWRRSKVYSLEDVLIRSAGFCLLFLNSHLSYSLDKQLGINYGLTAPSLIGLNFYCWTFGILMFSAGWEKLCSPMWRRGLGFFYFMSLRHWVKPNFHWANKSRRVSTVMSWATIGTQFLLILALLIPHLRLISFPMSLGFAISLCVMVYLAFLSTQTLLSSAFLFAIEFSPWVTGGSVSALSSGATGANAPLLWVVCFFLMLAVVSSSGLVKLRGGFITTLSAWTIALRPIMIFVETHIYGIYIFRQMAKLKDGEKSVLENWDINGIPSGLQAWHPRTIAGTTYRVTDYCIAVNENVLERAADRAESIVDLGYAAYLELSKEEREEVTEIDFQVRVFNPEEDYVPDTSLWLSSPWVSIGSIRGFPDNPHFIPGGKPPPYRKTLRWPVIFQ